MAHYICGFSGPLFFVTKLTLEDAPSIPGSTVRLVMGGKVLCYGQIPRVSELAPYDRAAAARRRRNSFRIIDRLSPGPRV